MILYVTESSLKGLLSETASVREWELDEVIIDNERPKLQQLIHERMQIVTEMQYIIIERSCVADDVKEFGESMDIMFSLWNDVQIILLEEELLDENGESLEVMYDGSIIMLNKQAEHFRDNLISAVSGDKINDSSRPESVWIGVVSSHSGAGATYAAFNLTKYISGIHGSVCYVEANESGDLSAMAEFYGMQKIEENHFRKDGLDYWHQSIDQEKQYVVLDLGKYSSAKLGLINHCSVKILISDGKPYRMQDIKTVYSYMDDPTVQIWLNYTDPAEHNEMKVQFLSDLQAGFLRWQPGLFAGRDPLYQDAVQDYIRLDKKQVKMSGFIKGLMRREYKTDRAQISEPEPNENVFQLMEQAEQKENIENLSVLSDGMDSDIQLQPENDGERSEDALMQYEQKHKKGLVQEIPVKILSVILLVGVVICGAWYLSGNMPEINLASGKADTGQESTQEKLDERLNINPDIRISVMEVEGADGYEVSYSTDENFDQKTTVIVEVETADKAVESLDAGKTYYVRVRAFKFDENGTKIYGDYTEVQRIRT